MLINYRKQIHEETLRKQLEMWRDLVLGYCQAHRIFFIDSSSVQLPFENTAISRKASAELIHCILEFMVAQGT